MGNALIMFTTPEETIMWESLYVRDANGKEVRCIELYKDADGRLTSLPGHAGIMRDHPRAYYKLRVPATAVWQPPEEPWRIHEWWKDKARWRAHREAVRESLQDFINERLDQLYWMVRTGHFVLGETRVRVTRCKPVPEYVMRELTKGFRRQKTSRK